MKRIFGLIAVMLLMATCASPTQPSSGGTISASIDGQPFRSNDAKAHIENVNGQPVLQVSGDEGTTSLSFLIRSTGQLAAGTTYTGVQGTLNLNINLSQPNVWGSNAGNAAQGGAQGNGIVTLSSLSSVRVSGSFVFEMVPLVTNNINGNKSVTQGMFDVQLQ